MAYPTTRALAHIRARLRHRDVRRLNGFAFYTASVGDADHTLVIAQAKTPYTTP
jgi:hypothetical protein